ncbi:MAG: NAD(+) synthase [Lachnospiraceae bacterium]
MKHGFIKVAAATPKIKVADTTYNTGVIIEQMLESYQKGARIIVFPELCITGYTCQDLFLQDALLTGALDALSEIIKASKDISALVFVGLPFEYHSKLFNVAAVISAGSLLAFIPKRYMPMYAEFYEGRHFKEGHEVPVEIEVCGFKVPFGTNILCKSNTMKELIVAAEICEDLWVPLSPSTSHALAGANLIVNLSASNETVGKDAYRNMLVASTSAKLVTGYIYCSSSEGESTQDLVFAGHNIIAENGSVIAEKEKFTCGITYATLDMQKLNHERRRMTTFDANSDESVFEKGLYKIVSFDIEEGETSLERDFLKTPFVPTDERLKAARCEEILSIQAYGLKKRIEHTNCKHAVIGISGGLDSTLALLVTVRAFDMLEIPREQIHAITMPCFGTTDRTYDNACVLTKSLGATLEEIDIKEAVNIHFRDIKHDSEVHNVTYENGQARERTQILMDIANRDNGMVIGTGDMSELALGWATYNGDHMSMYGVNAGVPKTLVRHLVKYYADACGEKVIEEVLLDILDTPVSPELLPPVDGVIAQKTEDLVGPYELHDFFLYYMLRFGFSPKKVYRIATATFADVYDEETIMKWLQIFYKRFFSQQFKRSCLPDGPKVGSVSVSPRGDLRMPSDACARLWLDELNE